MIAVSEFRRRENRAVQASLIVLFTNAYFVGSLPSTNHLNPWFHDKFPRSSTILRETSWDRSQLATSQYAAKLAHHARRKLHLRSSLADGNAVIRLRGGEDAIMMDGVCSLTIPGDVDTMERAVDIFEEKQVGSSTSFTRIVTKAFFLCSCVTQHDF
jgi:hypothetical protein